MDINEIRNAMEKSRLAIVTRIKRLAIIGVVLLIVNLIILGVYPEIIAYAAVISLIIFLVPAGITLDQFEKYKKYFKQEVMPRLAATIGDNITYNYRDGIKESKCMEAKLLKRPDQFYTEDLVKGEFEGVRFASSDIIMKERKVRRDSKGRTYVTYETYFSGRWFVYDFNKTFKGIIQVREGGFLDGPQWGLGLKKFQMEDVEFNKKFSTYATNQHDAFYVLTPTLMEKIKELEKKYPGRIYMSFIGTELHIAVNGAKNAFEAPVFRPIDEKFIEEQLYDLKLIQDMVHELRLNRNIFK